MGPACQGEPQVQPQFTCQFATYFAAMACTSDAGDIPILVSAFVEQFSAATGRRITSIPRSTLDALQRYPWPGNVRELRNVVERAVILSRGPRLTVELPGPACPAGPASLLMKDVEREHLLRVLEQTGWRLKGPGGAAETLGLKRTTLQSRMARLGLRRPRA